MPPRRRKRIDPALFELPVDHIRAGYFSDVYVNRSREALRVQGRSARVTWQVSAQRAGCQMMEVLQLKCAYIMVIYILVRSRWCTDKS